MSSIRAVVVDPDFPGRFAIEEIEASQPGPSEALVQVAAFSLNRGDAIIRVKERRRPGWDLAGTVIKQAANGTGPKVGSRVMGIVNAGAWAEQVAVPTNRLAELPASVTFAQAATLPTAGLTALRALEKGGSLLHKRVLITGSAGGVGLFAHQLARLVAEQQLRTSIEVEASWHDIDEVVQRLQQRQFTGKAVLYLA